MTTQLQDIKDRLSKIESDTAEARKMLEKVETGTKNAGPWRPENDSVAYRVIYDGLKQIWTVKTCRVFHSLPDCITYIELGAYFRTEAEALEVATQRQFFTELWSVGAESPTSRAFTPMLTFNGHMIQHWVEVCTGARKFPDVESMNAFIEKWGGEKAVAERISKGWR